MSFQELWESESFFICFLLFSAISLVIRVGVFLIKKWDQWEENEDDKEKEEETKGCRVIFKRNSTDKGSLVLFEFDDGKRLELFVDYEQESIIAANDVGSLTLRGRKFIKFEREINA